MGNPCQTYTTLGSLFLQTPEPSSVSLAFAPVSVTSFQQAPGVSASSGLEGPSREPRERPLPQGGSSIPGAESLAWSWGQLISAPARGFPQSVGLTASPFPLGREQGGWRGPGRGGGSLAHREAVLFSGRPGRKLGGPLRVSNCALDKTAMQRGAAGRAGPDKSLGGDWQGLPVPRVHAEAWAPPAWQFLRILVSRGDGPPRNLPPRGGWSVASSGSSFLLCGLRWSQDPPSPPPASSVRLLFLLSWFYSRHLKNLPKCHELC